MRDTMEDNPAYNHAMAFLDCLTEESCHYILQLPKSGVLNPDQHATLRRIFQHFDQQNSEAQYDSPSSSHSDRVLTINDSDNDHARPTTPQSVATGLKRSGPGRPRKLLGSTPTYVARKCWGLILAMQDCELDSVLQCRLKANPNNDATQFLQTPLPLFHDSNERTTPSIKVLTSLCRKVEEMSNRIAEDRVQWLFLELTVGDMATFLFGLKSSSKKRDVSASIISEEGNDAWEEIQPTIRIANKLVFICSKLGSGCLFWLHSQLTKTFLLNRVTETGGAYDEAMEHLHNLQLREKIAKSGAKRLGDAIRSHLQNVYQIGQPTSDGADIMDISSNEQSIMET